MVEHVCEIFGGLREVTQRVIYRAALVVKRSQMLRLRVSRKFLDQIEGAGVVTFSFRVAIKSGCVIARMNQILNRTREIPSLLEMYGELGRDLWRTFAVVL